MASTKRLRIQSYNLFDVQDLEDFGYLICYTTSTQACSIRTKQKPEQKKDRRFNGGSNLKNAYDCVIVRCPSYNIVRFILDLSIV